MLKQLSRKEITAIIMFITAFICILNAALFGNVLPTNSSYVQLTQQSTSIGTAYICILYGLSTWLYHSNYSEPRQHMRYVLLAMVMAMLIGNFISLVLIVKGEYFAKINEAIHVNDLFTPFGVICNIVTIVLIVLTIILLLVVFVLVCMTAIKKSRMSKDLSNSELI